MYMYLSLSLSLSLSLLPSEWLRSLRIFVRIHTYNYRCYCVARTPTFRLDVNYSDDLGSAIVFALYSALIHLIDYRHHCRHHNTKLHHSVVDNHSEFQRRLFSLKLWNQVSDIVHYQVIKGLVNVTVYLYCTAHWSVVITVRNSS